MNRLKWLLLLSFITLHVSATPSLPAPELPKYIKPYWIAKEIKINKVWMNMRGFYVKEDLEGTLNTFRHFLGGFGKQITEQNIGGIHYLGVSDEEWFYTVELTQKRLGIEGVFVVSALPQLVGEALLLHKKVEYPGTLKLIISQVHEDRGRKFSLDILASRSGPAITSDVLISHLQEKGWLSPPLVNQQLLVFRRGSERLQAFVQERERTPGTLVLITKE